jgi:hypothetical protein
MDIGSMIDDYGKRNKGKFMGGLVFGHGLGSKVLKMITGQTKMQTFTLQQFSFSKPVYSGVSRTSKDRLGPCL